MDAAVQPIVQPPSGPATEAYVSARLAQSAWALTPLSARLRIVAEARRGLVRQALELAQASAAARQRPVRESLTAEVIPLADACRFLERSAPSLLRPRRLGRRGRPGWLPGVRSEIRREPWGVVLIIGPGNYPLLLPGVQMVQALVAGNSVLIKPAPGGRPAALALVEQFRRAGLDPRLVQVLPEDVETAMESLATGADKVIFTGSAATGRSVLAQLAPRLTPATMELSGSDAFIVRADADLDLVVEALRFGLELNGGATCMAPRRILVDRRCATELEGRLARAFSASSSSGPRQSLSLACRRSVEQAAREGAHVVAGEFGTSGVERLPIILAGLSPTSRVWTDDIFGPVALLATTGDDVQAVAWANASPFGLGAAIFTCDESAGRRLAASLRVGVVTINDVIVPTADPRLPFGGRGRSGFGVTRGGEGLLELTVPKVVTVTRARPRLAWAPARPGDENILAALAWFLHERGWRRWSQALPAFWRALRGQRAAGLVKPATRKSGTL